MSFTSKLDVALVLVNVSDRVESFEVNPSDPCEALMVTVGFVVS